MNGAMHSVPPYAFMACGEGGNITLIFYLRVSSPPTNCKLYVKQGFNELCVRVSLSNVARVCIGEFYGTLC